MAVENVAVTGSDVEDISKLVFHEADNIRAQLVGQGLSSQEAMTLAYGSIIDTIINRVALSSNVWGADIQSVMNFHSGSVYQFTALSDHSVTTAHDLPNIGANEASVESFVNSYIAGRRDGAPSAINANTHYYNPAISSPVWGPGMIYKTQIGEGSTQHVSGIPVNADGTPGERPKQYTITYDGITSDPMGPFNPAPLPPRKPDFAITDPDELNSVYPEAGDPEGADSDAEDTDVDFIDLLIYDWFLDAENVASPLVLDLDGNGIELSSLNSVNAVYWDLNSDGFAEATGWTISGDGLLAIDLNDDGIINRNSELFGNSASHANGFMALAVYDTNHDNQITSGDARFNDLLVWIDANQNGYSEEGELHTLSALGITSISTTWTDTNTTISGNSIKQTSTFIIGGNSRTIVDAWFDHSTVNTVYNQDFILDARTYFLPEMRGYGILAPLSVIMSLDNNASGNLLGLVENLKDKTFAQIFDNTTTLSTDVKAIMWRWAGVDGVSATARGPYVDARDLGFLEKLLGQDFLQRGNYHNPYGPDAGHILNQAINTAFNNIYARLVAQSAGGELLEGDWSYNPVTDSFEGVTGLVQSKLDSLETEAQGLANLAARQDFWSNVLRMVEFTVGVSNLTTPEYNALNTAIEDSDSGLDLASLVANLTLGGTANTTVNGSSGNDTLNGTGGDNILNGLAGNDTLSGGAGNDTLNGDAGDDSLTGGTGGDYLKGGANNDTYYYNVGDGYDTIYDLGTNTGQTDTIVFGSGITAGDLTFTRVGPTDLLIQIGGATPGQILIEQQFYNTAYRRIETISLSGGTTIDLTTKVFTTHGTSGNDFISGIASTVASTTDTIYGYGGDDTLYGDDGDDVIYGGDGSDIVTGDNGADTLYGDDGGDRIYGYAGTDAMYGGTGDDFVSGGIGNDKYYYNVGDGKDTYSDIGNAADADEIVFGAGITAGNLTMTRQGNYDLLIQIGGATPGEIVVKDQFYVSGGIAAKKIETLRFSGGTTLDLTTQIYTTHGTEGNDSIAGIVNAGSTVDTIYGYGGNDSISGAGGADTIYGGDGNDTISGDADADILSGDAGNDTLYGGAGNDIYYYSTGTDIIGEGSSSPGGADEIRLRDGIVAEDLVFTRSGNSAVINIIGGESFRMDNVFGTASYIIETIRFFDNTTLDPTLKIYTTYGTSGGDTIYGITSGGSINEIFYGLDGADSLSAGTGNDILYGGNGNDSLYGGTGDDIFDGGAGNDAMDDGGGVSGSGNDTYIYSAGLDTIYDGGGGTDTIRLTNVTVDGITIATSGANDLKITVAAGVDELKILWWISSATNRIENISFSDGFSTTFTDYASWVYGTAGVDSLSGTANHDTIIGKAGNDTISGNGGADNIHGGDGNDTLNGNDGDDVIVGGTGNDTMAGGLGNDTFGVDSASDVVTEAASAGTDTILTSVSYSVSANVENMTLIGTGNINATGSSIANVLTGNSGNNNIDGLGGADTMLGGLGDDTYVVDNTSDVVTEYAGEGTDVIQSSVTYTLSANVENLTLTNSSNINGTGNGLRNTIIGNSGINTLYGGDNNDTLSGEGGNDTLYGQNGIDLLWADAGVDNLYGGAGADTFKFATTSLGGSDYIKDFSAAQGDIINVHDLLVGYDPLTKLLTDFVEITTSGANSLLKVDRDGTGSTYSWTQIAQIDGVTGMTDEAALVTSGNLVI